jgi:hypothetical protein
MDENGWDTAKALRAAGYVLSAAFWGYLGFTILSNYASGLFEWLGYSILAMVALGVYLEWFDVPRRRLWYIAISTFLIGVGLIYMNNEHQPFSYERLPPHSARETALNWGIVLTIILPLYATWRIARWLVIRAFGVLLIAVSELSAAWHSGKADKRP